LILQFSKYHKLKQFQPVTGLHVDILAETMEKTLQVFGKQVEKACPQPFHQ
jgi:hypothetical protein